MSDKATGTSKMELLSLVEIKTTASLFPNRKMKMNHTSISDSPLMLKITVCLKMIEKSEVH